MLLDVASDRSNLALDLGATYFLQLQGIDGTSTAYRNVILQCML